MRYVILLLLAFILTTFSVSAQTYNDSIAIKKIFLGEIYKKGGKSLSVKKLEKKMKVDPEAYYLFKKGKIRYDIANALAFAGGWIVGYEVGSTTNPGSNIDVMIIAGGLGLIGVSIPISISGRKWFRSSILTYNSNKRKSSGLLQRSELNLSFTGNGIGLRLDF